MLIKLQLFLYIKYKYIKYGCTKCDSL